MVIATINHIIDIHGKTDIAYLTGSKGHPHAENRLKAYKAAMQKHGLNIDDSRIYYGDFWHNSGKPFIDSLLKSEKGLPEAIICANDYMAESVYRYLMKLKIKVPKDILIAGYIDDNKRLPFITASIRNSTKTGKQAYDILLKMINGENFDEPYIYTECDFTIRLSITCGCKVADDYNYLDGGVILPKEDNDYFSETNIMVENLLACDNYTDLLWRIDWSTGFLGNFDD